MRQPTPSHIRHPVRSPWRALVLLACEQCSVDQQSLAERRPALELANKHRAAACVLQECGRLHHARGQNQSFDR